MHHLVSKDMADCPWIGIMPSGRDALRRHASHGPCRAAEGLSGGEVPCVTELHIDPGPGSINRTVEILPPPLNAHVGLIDVPTGVNGTTASLT
jgi:hypothetical protein